jgi:predicted lipid-binding transport protein (Tim44 family)
MLALSFASLALPALADEKPNPFVSFAWYASFYGLPVLIILLIGLITYKSIRDFKKKRAAFAATLAAGQTAETTPQETAASDTAASDTASPETAAQTANAEEASAASSEQAAAPADQAKGERESSGSE